MVGSSACDGAPRSGSLGLQVNPCRLTLVRPSPQYSKHLFVHIGQTNPAFSDPPLEAVDVRQIYDKFPEKKGGLKELYEKGPPNAFFLVKFWVRLLPAQHGQLARLLASALLHDQRAPGWDLRAPGWVGPESPGWVGPQAPGWVGPEAPGWVGLQASGGMEGGAGGSLQPLQHLVPSPQADLNSTVQEGPGAFYGVSSQYSSADSMTISVSTKVCSFGKQVVEKVEVSGGLRRGWGAQTGR